MGGYANKEEVNRRPPPSSLEEPLERSLTTIKPQKKQESLLLDDNNQTETIVPEGVATDPATGARTRKIRNVGSLTMSSSDNVTQKQKIVDRKGNNSSVLSDKVSISSNAYKKVPFGGIRNLELTVTNNSNHTLDNVLVEVQYLKPSEQPLRTENIQFKGVGPNSTSTIRLPDTNRGIGVSYRIIQIKTKSSEEGMAEN